MQRRTRLLVVCCYCLMACLCVTSPAYTQSNEAPQSVQTAMTFFQQGQWAKATEAFEQAAARQPLLAEAMVQWGAALAQLKRHEEVLSKFEQAVALSPQDAVAYRYWGFSLGEVGRYEDAIDKFQQALRLNPQDARAHYGWGVALYLLGRPEEARPKFQQAMALDPKLLSPDAQRTLKDTGLLEENSATTPSTR